MNQGASEKLKRLGLDVEFLAWLEGEEQRLPDLNRVRAIKDADFAAAIRAAEWLGQYFTQAELISPHPAEEWRTRYELLQRFLYDALGASLFFHMESAGQDLEALERVLGILLPGSFWQQYREDIRHLRKRGLPLDVPEMQAKRSGGVPVSEQTIRMRAAVTYVSTVSKKPFGDLASFWNERLGEETYRAEQIRDRIRRVPAFHHGEGTARSVVEYWKKVYHGDLRAAFPGPFPLSPKLKERYSPS